MIEIKLVIFSVLAVVLLMVGGIRLIGASIGIVFAIIVLPFYAAFYFLIYLAAFIGIAVKEAKPFLKKADPFLKKTKSLIEKFKAAVKKPNS